MLHAIVLGIIQGITEFLPISSSAHLVLVPKIFHWADANLGFAFDVALHMGTLLAIIIYFHKDCIKITIGFFKLFVGQRSSEGLLAIWIIISTIPIVIFGYIYSHYYPESTSSLKILGSTSIIFGILLWVSDKFFSSQRKIKDFSIKDAILIGIAQVFAIIPGSSRSGTTMTMARFLSVDRDESAKYSMLISIPTIIGSGLLEGIHVHQEGKELLNTTTLIGVAVSFIVAIIAVDFLMDWLKKSNFTLFVIYRVLLGIILLTLAYTKLGM